MPHKSEEEDSSPETKDFVFLLAIAGRLDAQSKIFAKKLNNDRYVYHSYSVLDSLSSSYSIFKYFFEVFISNSNDQILMHEIMTSPGGIAAITTEALFLVTFSFLASYFDGQNGTKSNKFKHFVVAAWPFFRDAIKGLKNAYKGWKSLAQIIMIMSDVDIKHLIVPVGLVLGILAAANRFWLRNMVETRKDMMDANKKLLDKIQRLLTYDEDEAKKYLSELHYQECEQRTHAFFAAAVGGFIDGLYLYAGVLSLSVLSPQIYIVLASISLFYTLSCIVSRVYEEYNFQLRLLITQNRCCLVLAGKELETAYTLLMSIEDHDSEAYQQQKEIVLELINKVDEFRIKLQKQITHSYATAALLGLKHGLFAYGVISTTLFMVCSVFSITAAVFPPALLIACISIGLALMLGVMMFTTIDHYKDREKQKNKEDAPYNKIDKMKNEIAKQIAITSLPQEEFKAALEDGTSLQEPPQYFFQEWLEILRSFTSGISKGNNFATFISTPFQDKDPTEHNDLPVGLMVTFASAALFSVILALRAFARGFGRTPPGQLSEDDTAQQPDGAEEADSAQDAYPKNTPDIPAPTNWAETIIRYAGSFFTRSPAAKNVVALQLDKKPKKGDDPTVPGILDGNTIGGLS